jgi:RNA polymerase sigma-70 factor (family 1)
LTDGQPYNEQELLRQLADGSENAFRALFHAYRDKLYNYVVKLCGSTETAEDTVHDVFLKLWEKKAELPEMYNLDAYLYRMARNKSIDVFRLVAREGLMLSEIGREQGLKTGFEGEDRITHQEVLDAIKIAVNKLTPQQRQVFLMSRQQGLKIGEIARQLEIAERTAKNHLSEALRFLREEMGQQYGPNAIIIFALYNLTIA